MSIHNGRRRRRGRQRVFFSSLCSFSFLFFFLVVCCIHSMIVIMPSWCVYHFLIQSLLIFDYMKRCSSNESSHQIFKVDLGQDLTMSCLFDQDKLEQVWNNQIEIQWTISRKMHQLVENDWSFDRSMEKKLWTRVSPLVLIEQMLID